MKCRETTKFSISWGKMEENKMTIQQEAYEKIMKLPDNGVRLIIALADEIARQESFVQHVDAEEERKKKAYQDMLGMKERSTYPRDFDYEKVREEAVNEKFIYTN